MPTSELTTSEAGAQITRDNLHWGSAIGASAGPISFGFRTLAPSYSVSGENIQGTFSAFSVAEQTAARDALATWASLANIAFLDVGNSNSAAIEFGNYNSSTDNSEAFAFFPGNTSASSSAGDVFVNTYYASTSNDARGTYEYMTFLHEIGHALGLEHPADYNAGPNGIPTYQDSATYIEDTRQYSLMSYFSETYTGGHYTVYDETPMLDDIAAIQRLYGANPNTRNGDDTYGFHSTLSGTAFGIASASQHVVFTAYDTGGNDTFDFSGYGQQQTIDLNSEHFSSVGGDTHNVSIAQNVTIENAIGGSGDDTIIGNHAANAINGGAGNDHIYGNDGADLLNGGAGVDTMMGGGGDDVYWVDNSGDRVIELPNEGVDTVYSDLSFILPANVERLALNGSADLSGTGNGQDSVLFGNIGNNVLDDAGGHATMLGDGGDDIYRIHDSNDQIIEYSGGGVDTVYASVSYTLSANVERLSLEGAANLDGTGNGQYSVLFGNTGDNVLSDGGGEAVMLGSGGNDVYLVHNRADQIIEYGAQGVDTVYAFVNYTLPDNVDRIVLESSNNLNATGNSGDNVFFGNGGDNTFTGGAGDDSFVLGGSFGKDSIADFNLLQDHVYFEGTSLRNMTDLLQHSSDAAGGVVISVDANTSLTLVGTTFSELQAHQADFILM
jgi:Ca2+-binding RTX toxin-like protein